MTVEPTDQQDHDPDHPVRPVMRLWHKLQADSKRGSAARRARVLAHEDLAQRLTEPPLRLSHPTKWSGWIPPRTLAQEACGHCSSSDGDRRCRNWPHRSPVNDSPIRQQLVEIATEAMAREGAS